MSSTKFSDHIPSVVRAEGITKIFKDRSKIRDKYRHRNFIVRWFKEILSKERKTVLKDLSFDLEEGEVLGLLGPNGAGKTTMMKICTGLMNPDEGKVEVLGHNMSTESKETRSRINAVFSRGNLFRHLSTYDNLKLFSEIYDVEDYDEKIDKHLEKLEIEDRRNAYLDRLSTGERTKIKLIKAFLTEPEVLFLDEPTSGLDPKMSVKIREHIDELNSEGVSILLTTHYMEEADYLCDRVILIDKGEIIKEGNPVELKEEIKDETIIEFRLRKFKTESLETIENLEEVEDVRYIPDEEKVRVIIRDVEKSEEIIREVKDLELGIRSIEFDEPTLEDVFIHLTGRELE